MLCLRLKLHILVHLSIPGGWNCAYIRSLGSGSRDTGWLSKFLYLGMNLNWLLAKVPEVAHTISFYPRESKLNIFLLYEHYSFWDMGQFSNLPYLVMKKMLKFQFSKFQKSQRYFCAPYRLFSGWNISQVYPPPQIYSGYIFVIKRGTCRVQISWQKGTIKVYSRYIQIGTLWNIPKIYLD